MKIPAWRHEADTLIQSAQNPAQLAAELVALHDRLASAATRSGSHVEYKETRRASSALVWASLSAARVAIEAYLLPDETPREALELAHSIAVHSRDATAERGTQAQEAARAAERGISAAKDVGDAPARAAAQAAQAAARVAAATCSARRGDRRPKLETQLKLTFARALTATSHLVRAAAPELKAKQAKAEAWSRLLAAARSPLAVLLEHAEVDPGGLPPEETPSPKKAPATGASGADRLRALRGGEATGASGADRLRALRGGEASAPVPSHAERSARDEAKARRALPAALAGGLTLDAWEAVQATRAEAWLTRVEDEIPLSEDPTLAVGVSLIRWALETCPPAWGFDRIPAELDAIVALEAHPGSSAHRERAKEARSAAPAAHLLREGLEGTSPLDDGADARFAPLALVRALEELRRLARSDSRLQRKHCLADLLAWLDVVRPGTEYALESALQGTRPSADAEASGR